MCCKKLAAAILAITVSSPAFAFWPDAQCGQTCRQYKQTHAHKLAAHMKAGYHENSMWPYPYVCPDRRWVREPFETMIHNGWRQQNLLGAHHFDKETNQLTRAGELKVRWILTQAPDMRRQVYVERDINPDITKQRMAATEQFAAVAAMPNQDPIVQDTHIVSQGRPAAAVDLVNRSYAENMLPAVLPTASSTTGSE